jgi:hypothetical protein
MVGDLSFHRWRNAQGLMNPAKIIVHVLNRHGMLVIFHLHICRPVETFCRLPHLILGDGECVVPDGSTIIETGL